MGLCRDFGSQIAEGCNHLMRAGSESCHCDQCGVVCKGRFAACPSVWAQGPQPVVVLPSPSPDLLPPLVAAGRQTNGHGENGTAPPEAATATIAGDLGMGAPTDDPAIPNPGGANPAEANPGRASPGGANPAGANPAGAKVIAAEGFRWFQGEFEGLRVEVERLRTALAEEQAALATRVSTSVEEAVRREATDLRTELMATVAGLRHDLEATRLSHEERVAGLQAALAKATSVASAERAGLKSSMKAVAAAAATETAGLQTSVEAITGIHASFVAVAADNAGLPAELNRRDAAGRRAFRATLREELQPLVDVVAESVAQSDYELKELGRRVDQLMESDASMSEAITQVAASLAEMAGASGVDDDGDGDGEAPEPAVRPVRSGLLDRVAGGAAPSAPAAAWIASTPRRPSSPRSTPGIRVSSRRSQPAD